MVSLGPLICRLLPPGNGKVLLARSQRVLNQYLVFALPAGVQPLFGEPADYLGYGDMTGSLQDHLMKDDEPLRVLLSVPHPLQLLPQLPTNLRLTLPLSTS